MYGQIPVHIREEYQKHSTFMVFWPMDQIEQVIPTLRRNGLLFVPESPDADSENVFDVSGGFVYDEERKLVYFEIRFSTGD